MTSTNVGGQVGGYRREVDSQKLGPALLIASSLVLAIRTAKWSPTHSDGLSASRRATNLVCLRWSAPVHSRNAI
jgi:hypothetical protein